MKRLNSLSTIIYILLLCACSEKKPAKDVKNYIQKGNIFFDNGNYRLAITEYDSAIAQKRDFVTAYIKKGLALEYQGQIQEAIENYTAIDKITPKETRVLIKRGQLYNKIQMYNEAIADLEIANIQNPDNPYILNELGLAKIHIGDTSGLNYLNKSITKDSTNYESYFSRGLAKTIMQEHESAIKDFEKTITLKPSASDAYFGMGFCNFQLHNKSTACKYWQIALAKGSTIAQKMLDENCK